MPNTLGEQRLTPYARRSLEVIENGQIGAYHLLKLADDEGPAPRPGQFYMLSSEGWGGEWRSECGRPYLPRAMSAWQSNDSLYFMVEAVGPGTAELCRLGSGDTVFALGPLGHGFSLPTQGLDALLVAGGVGVPPILALERELRRSDSKFEVLAGFRSARYASAAGLFETVEVAVDDDSVPGAHRGLVTDLMRQRLESNSSTAVYACGPPPMLEAVRSFCLDRGVSAQLALEAPMACGFGACFGCAIKVKDRYLRLCIDGPVVDADILDSAWLGGGVESP